MGNLIVFDMNVHRATFVDLCKEYFNWMASELQKNYDIDVFSMLETTLQDYVENTVDEFASSILLDGVLYLLQVKGEIIGVVLVFRDQTEERQIQKELEYSEKNLKNAQRIAKMGNWSWNLDIDKVTWSDTMYEIYQIPKQKITFELEKSKVHPEDLQFWLDTVQKGVENKEPFTLEFRIIGNNKNVI